MITELVKTFEEAATKTRMQVLEAARERRRFKLIMEIDYSFEDIRVTFDDRSKAIIPMLEFVEWRNEVYLGDGINDDYVMDSEPNEEVQEYLEMSEGYNCKLYICPHENATVRQNSGDPCYCRDCGQEI